MLQLKDIHVHYGGVKALDGFSAEIKEGEIVAFMGPNGAGKSTALKSIFGLAPVSAGDIIWRGNKIKNPKPHEMVPLGLSFVPQGKRVFKHLTVKENLEVGGFGLQDKSVLKERIKEVLELFPALLPKLKQKAGQLSGGQQQMVAIARGLITDPRLLLLDEPSLGLAPKVVKEVFEKIQEINQKRKTAIIVVEHNLKSLLPIVHRAYVLDKGKMVKHGNPAELMETKILEKVFLGALV
ncbi:MAG: ABC transporter ATP-binding protein [Candidatus Pacebacteria bacterium]|nr:ABC transporter ATP-binding protein [Candidatus Paceibacterota bacterium]